MHATIGVYDDHDLAVNAVIGLKDAGYPVQQLTIIGLRDREEIDENNEVVVKEPMNAAGIGLGTGMALGTAAGILTGVGLLAIPGLGILYGAGALVGAIAGFDIGMVGGGLAAVLAVVGFKDEQVKKYHHLLQQGKYIVVADGTKEDISRAKTMLHELGNHSDLNTYNELGTAIA